MSLAAGHLQQEYEELKSRGFPLGEALEFGAKLGRSKEIALHFELILEDGKRPRPQRWHPEDYFRFHGQDGVLYLRQCLTSENRDYAVDAAYLMAELLLRGRYPHQDELLNELNRVLVLLSDSEAPEHRRKCLIALGWVGTEYEIPTLEKHLMNDADPLCRAWSASSFLQMSGRIPNDILKAKTAGVLAACLEQETDVFVRGVAVEAIQQIWHVKFGLGSSSVESRNQKAVDRAARRALEYLAAEN